MKKEIINNEIILLEYEGEEKLKKIDIDYGYNCIFKICPICKTSIHLKDCMCRDCEERLLKEEEYIYFIQYSNWLENRENVINEMFDNIIKKMKNELFNEDKISYKELKEEVKNKREIITSKKMQG